MTSAKLDLDFRVVALGIFSAISIQAEVQIIPLEILAVIFFLMQFGKAVKFRNKSLQNFLNRISIAGFCLIVVQIFTDLYLQAPIIETIKSVAQIVTLVALIFAGINWFSRSDRNLRSFVIGYCLSAFVTFFFFRDAYIKIDPWKFLFANVTTIALLYLIGMFRIRTLKAVLLILTLASTHLVLGSRSAALFALLCILPMIIPRTINLQSGGIFILLLISIAIILISEKAYQSLALEGSLGITQQEKARQQFGSGPLLFFARSELLYEITAIKENFVTGKGSNPDLTETMLFKVAQSEEKIGLQTKKTAAYQGYKLDGKIPQHSMLFSSWVEAGFIGLIFWTFVLIFLLRNLPLVLRSRGEFSFLTFYLITASLWALFFSPLGAGSRLFTALTISALARFILQKNID